MTTTKRELIGTIVLAAGASRRMGRDKLSLDVGGEPLLRRVTGRVLAAKLGPVTVVLPPGDEERRAAVADLGVVTISNPAPERGLTSSIRCGLAGLEKRNQVAAVVLTLADMPHVGTEMLRAVAAAWREDRPPLVLSDYGGIEAPPVLFGRKLFAELQELPDDDGGARRIVGRYRRRAATVFFPAACGLDLDRPSDLQQLKLVREPTDRERSP